VAAAIVIALTLIGLAIRLWDVGAAGVWFDESYAVALAREPSAGAMLDALLANPPSTPLYFLLFRGWATFAGHTDAAIRLPSVVAGVLLIPATAWLGRELDGRTRVALLAAAFVTLSPYALEFAQEAAPYALAALTTTAAMAAGWRWRRTGRRFDGALAVLLGIAAVYVHYVAVVVLGALWLLGATGLAGTGRVDRRTWLAVGGLILLAWAPWLIGLSVHWLGSAAPRTAIESPATLNQVVGAFAQHAVGTAALLTGQRALLAAGLGLGAVLVAMGWLAGGAPTRRVLRAVVVIAAALFLVPAVTSAATGRWLFVPHFGLHVLAAGLVVIAAGAVEAGARVGRMGRLGGIDGRTVTASLAIAWCALGAIGIWLFRTDPPHGADGLRELVAQLESRASVEDPVLVSPAILSPSVAQYTNRRLTGIPTDFDLRDMYGPHLRPASDATLRQATLVASDDHPRVWLVHRPEGDPNGAVLAELDAGYDLVDRLETPFATLYQFEDVGE
jgi:uncharacterized membrane protein